jgi:hypothetical protein
MQIKELVEVLSYINKLYQSSEILDHYKDLKEALKTVRVSPNSPPDPIINEKLKNIENFYNEIEQTKSKWLGSKRMILEKVDPKGILAKTTIDNLAAFLNSPELDRKSCRAAVKSNFDSINLFFKNSIRLLLSLQIFDDAQEESKENLLTQNELALQLEFKNGLKVNTVKDLAKHLSIWQQIFINISKLTKQPVKDLVIHRASQSSNGCGVFIIGLKYNKITITAIIKCMLVVFHLYEKSLEIGKKILEIKKMDLEDSSIVRGLENEEKKAIGRIARTVTSKMLNEYGWNKGGNLKEVGNGVIISLKYLLDFIEKGGGISFYSGHTSSQYIELDQKLSMAYEKVDKLKSLMNNLNEVNRQQPETESIQPTAEASKKNNQNLKKKP